MLLSALSLECLDRILFFAGPNNVLYLLLTGDSVLVHKIKRTGSLAICWESSAYFDFNACLPLIHSFTDLQSLRLTTWSPKLLGRTRLNGDMFPTTLKSLELDFHDVFGILESVHCMKIFAGLTVLEHLSMVSTNEPSHYRTIGLFGFPRSLRSLRLSASSRVFVAHASSDMRDLPPHLETLHLKIPPKDNNSGGVILVPGAFPDHLQSLTSLSITLNVSVMLDTRHIGRRLLHLEALDGELLHDRAHVLRNPEPLQLFYPKLLSLTTDRCTFSSWSQLATLPPTLTSFNVPHDTLSDDYDTAKKELLAIQLDHTAQSLTFAPANLRSLENLGESAVWFPPDLLGFFPNLSKAYCTMVHQQASALSSLPKGLTELSLKHANVDWLHLLPSTLIRLGLSNLLPGSNSRPARSASPKLPQLMFLSILDGMPPELVERLPSSLQTLRFSSHSDDLLRSITLQSTQDDPSQPSILPHLHTIDFTLDNSHNEVLNVVELSLLTLPQNLKSLTVTGVVDFQAIRPSASLRHHHTLTSLKIIGSEVHPLTLLCMLPKTLRSLDARFSRPIDIADPEEAVRLYRFRDAVPDLRELILCDPRDAKKTDICCFTSAGICTSRYERLLAWLMTPLELKVIFLKALDGAWMKRHSGSFAVAEFVTAACLPRKLSLLCIPYTPYGSKKNTFHPILSDIRYLLQAVLKYQFPLLGLAFFDQKDYRNEVQMLREAAYLDLLPPYISQEHTPHPTRVFTNRTGFLPHDLYRDDKSTTPWVSSSEATYHLLNLLTWVSCAVAEPKLLTNGWLLPGLMWTSFVGSAIALPFTVWRWKKSSRALPPYHMAPSTSMRIGMALMAIGAPLMICLALARTEMPAHFQWITLGAGFFMATIGNVGVYATRK